MIIRRIGFTLLTALNGYVTYQLWDALWISKLVLKNGRRTTNFAKQYVVAVLAVVPFYLLTIFAALVYRAVCG